MHKGHNEIEEKTLEIQLAQDKTALRSRKGDTGSVLWRARYGIISCDPSTLLILYQLFCSAEFAQHVLRETATSPTALLDHDRLAEAHVLELG